MHDTVAIATLIVIVLGIFLKRRDVQSAEARLSARMDKLGATMLAGFNRVNDHLIESIVRWDNTKSGLGRIASYRSHY